MKKHLLLALALLPGALTANAAIDMYMGEQKLDIDGTYTFNTITDYDLGGYMIDPELELMSTVDAMVNITAKCTSGQTIQLCIGGTCTPGTTVVKEDIELEPNKKTNLEFEYINQDVTDPTLLPKNITTIFTIESDVQGYEDLTYTIVLNADGSGIAAVVDGDRNVAYANGELIYNVSKPGALTLCDANGRIVLDAAVSGNGSISLANLAKGIYIYRLGHNAGKILVK